MGKPKRPAYSMWPQEERERAVHGGQHCRDPYNDSVYRITLAESSSMSGGSQQQLGGGVVEGMGAWTLTSGKLRNPMGQVFISGGGNWEAGPGRGQRL